MAMVFTIDEVREMAVIRVGDYTIERRIQKDEMGRLYFYVPNLLNNPSHSPINLLFTRRIKDAVETIRNGDGDVLRVSDFFATEKVLYFLDRDYGEKIRKRFLEGWKNAKFAYAIKHDINGELDIDDNYHVYGVPSGITTRYFETEEEAQSHLEQLKKVAKKDVERYNSLSEEDRRSFFDDNFSSAREALFLWLLEKEENPNIPHQLRIVQTIRKS